MCGAGGYADRPHLPGPAISLGDSSPLLRKEASFLCLHSSRRATRLVVVCHRGDKGCLEEEGDFLWWIFVVVVDFVVEAVPLIIVSASGLIHDASGRTLRL